jgi:phage terminase large subunit
MQLSKKQNEYIINATHRWNIKSGAVRSGKSFVDTAYIVPKRIRERAGLPGLNVIMGVSKESIERNVLQPMREIYTSDLIGNINNRNVARVCGEDVYCLGAEKVSQVAKIQGASIKYCYGDEIAKWNKEVFQMLKSRLDKPYSCFDGACNPEHPTHWLKEFIDNVELDIYLQKYTIFDNPFLDPEFVKQLCKEYEVQSTMTVSFLDYGKELTDRFTSGLQTIQKRSGAKSWIISRRNQSISNSEKRISHQSRLDWTLVAINPVIHSLPEGIRIITEM